jgi:hypothetical protein
LAKKLNTSDDRDWGQARRAAFVQDALAVLARRPADLLPFEEVRHKLQLGNVHDLGLQKVPLDHIVGSVGRYQDFTRAFFPRRHGLHDRWQRINNMVGAGRDLPPVELYKVGQVYFVRDGNHRVSVARQRRFPTIAARVLECETPFPLGPDTDIDEMLCRVTHTAFMERTHLDHLCPDVSLRLTQPDGYQALLEEIETFRGIIGGIDERDVPFDEGVTLWCEMCYTPVVDTVRQDDILREFPGRTEADLYLWLSRNHGELKTRYGGHVSLEEAAGDLAGRFGERASPARRLGKMLRRWGRKGMNRGAAWWAASRRRLSKRSKRRSRL